APRPGGDRRAHFSPLSADTNRLGVDLPTNSLLISVSIGVETFGSTAWSQLSVNAGACRTISYWNLAKSGLGEASSSLAALEVVGMSPLATSSSAYASEAHSFRKAIAASLLDV